jgi:hypothetical protein
VRRAHRGLGWSEWKGRSVDHLCEDQKGSLQVPSVIAQAFERSLMASTLVIDCRNAEDGLEILAGNKISELSLFLPTRICYLNVERMSRRCTLVSLDRGLAILPSASKSGSPTHA